MTAKPVNLPWTDERVARLKQLHAEGKSSREASDALGGTTPNAVVNKAQRLDIRFRRKDAPADRVLAAPVVKRDRYAGSLNARQGRTGASMANKPAPIPAPAPANDSSMRLVDRQRLQCAWPVGSPARPAEQMCCGAAVTEGQNAATESYCPRHAQQALSRDAQARPADAKRYERSMRRFAA